MNNCQRFTVISTVMPFTALQLLDRDVVGEVCRDFFRITGIVVPFTAKQLIKGLLFILF